jgi:hypothetical protein
VRRRGVQTSVRPADEEERKRYVEHRSASSKPSTSPLRRCCRTSPLPGIRI